MHRPRSARTARSIKLGAWLLYLFCLSAVATIAVITCALVLNDRQLFVLALALLAWDLVLLVTCRLVASGARCPLCMGPIFLSRRCQRNQHARKIFGSYRLRVAGNIILTNTFKCPYCGESTRCTPKKRPSYRPATK